MEEWRVRRAFQHWSIIAIGILVPASALLGESSDLNVPMNATLLSLVLLGSTIFELMGLHVWQDTSVLLCGIWLAVSPFAFGYAEVGVLRFWHVTIGVMLMLLAIFNLWKNSRAPHRKR